MDLAADKVLVAGVLIAMVEANLVPTWIAATILIREFVVQAVRQLAAAEDVVISARALGKAKTLTTLAGLGLLFLAADAMTGGPMAATGAGTALELIGFWLLVLATVLTVVSGLAYLRGAWPILIGSSDAI
jgi:CDP-diacylglycerol--glycerol-3-phosphate 3-phosphatidyltransferase